MKVWEPWFEDPAFVAVYKQLQGRTLVDPVKAHFLWSVAQHVYSSLDEGAVAEVGVYKGGTAKLLAFAMPDRIFYGFDTFEGMPEVDPAKDAHKKGDFNDTSLEEVRRFLIGEPELTRGITLVKGRFPDTAGVVKDEKFSFVHVDCDIYRSVMDCCEFFYPRLVPGGVMVSDDYGWGGTKGAKLAFDEFFADKPEKPIYVASAQCLVVKR